MRRIYAHGLAQAAASPAQPDESARVADILSAGVAGDAMTAEEGGLDGASLADFESCDIRADFRDGS